MAQLQAMAEERVRVVPMIIDFLGTFLIPATTSEFIIREKFVIDTSCKAEVKISFLGDNFKGWFLDKREKSIVEQILKYSRLLKCSTDRSIIADLGGEVKAEVTLSELFYLMKIQGKGEEGILLTNGYANVFYVKDTACVLRAVHVHWHGGGWHVIADSVEAQDVWSEGRQVFSRSSVT